MSLSPTPYRDQCLSRLVPSPYLPSSPHPIYYLNHLPRGDHRSTITTTHTMAKRNFDDTKSIIHLPDPDEDAQKKVRTTLYSKKADGDIQLPLRLHPDILGRQALHLADDVLDRNKPNSEHKPFPIPKHLAQVSKQVFQDASKHQESWDLYCDTHYNADFADNPELYDWSRLHPSVLHENEEMLKACVERGKCEVHHAEDEEALQRTHDRLDDELERRLDMDVVEAGEDRWDSESVDSEVALFWNIDEELEDLEAEVEELHEELVVWVDQLDGTEYLMDDRMAGEPEDWQRVEGAPWFEEDFADHDPEPEEDFESLSREGLRAMLAYRTWDRDMSDEGRHENLKQFSDMAKKDAARIKALEEQFGIPSTTNEAEEGAEPIKAGDPWPKYNIENQDQDEVMEDIDRPDNTPAYRYINGQTPAEIIDILTIQRDGTRKSYSRVCRENSALAKKAKEDSDRVKDLEAQLRKARTNSNSDRERRLVHQANKDAKRIKHLEAQLDQGCSAHAGGRERKDVRVFATLKLPDWNDLPGDCKILRHVLDRYLTVDNFKYGEEKDILGNPFLEVKVEGSVKFEFQKVLAFQCGCLKPQGLVEKWVQTALDEWKGNGKVALAEWWVRECVGA